MSAAQPQKTLPHPDLVRGLEAQRKGNATDAEALYRKVAAGDRRNFDARSLLGTLLVQTGRTAEGLDVLEAAANLRPGSPNVQRNIGIVRLQIDDAAGAEAAFSAALRVRPDDIESLRGRCRALLQLGRSAEAEAGLRKAAALAPDPASDLTDLGGLLAQQEKYREAIEVLAAAAKLQPKSAIVHFHAGRCFRGLHEPEKARVALETALSLDQGSTVTRLALAEVLRDLHLSQEALVLIEASIKRAPDNANLMALKASLLLDTGRREDALDLYRALALIPAQRAAALLELAQSKTLKADDPDAALILEPADSAAHPDENAALCFARGKCLEDLGHHDEAFANYAKARSLRKASTRGRAPTGPDAILRAFDASVLQGSSAAGQTSEQPVFIIGMPRSGTSLVEQIIASHPQARGAGELYDMLHLGQELGLLQSDHTAIREAFRRIDAAKAETLAGRYLHALGRSGAGAARIADKMPHNFLMLGLIARIFPKARVIHVRRNPADTCVSCFANNLSDYHRYANDLGTLGRYYANYDRLMQHWQSILPSPMHELTYETLVAEPEQQSRQLIAFLGLDWDDACLRFFSSGRTVTTFSRGQVREPIYSRSIGRWRNFASHLQPLFEGLGALAPSARAESSGASSGS